MNAAEALNETAIRSTAKFLKEEGAMSATVCQYGRGSVVVMNAEQIERRVEKTTDRIDARFMNGELTQEQYDAEMKELNAWADQQYDALVAK